ncbi:Metallo-dependent phosphatase-like protein [Lentinula raphanica]|nr:Metallo-dependent phosphatase-like protein [Lentinula raphanica]
MHFDSQIPSVLKPFTRHIVAVGDLHGDLPNALRVLKFSNVINDEGNWSGKVDFFVQTGDIIDRGDDTIKLFELMEKLREQAPSTGGVVLSHLGNHEWMNAIGDWRYVYPSEIKTFGTVEARQRMISVGSIGSAWASNYTVASRLPLHPYLGSPNTPYPPVHLENGPLSHAALSFVHGGLSPTYEALAPFPNRINDLGTSLLRKLQRREQPPPHPPYPYPGLPASATTEEHELYDANGPLWYRGWALEPEEKVCVDVEKVLNVTGTRRMIMGHTPDFHNIVSRCNGKIIIIDTGISHAYGGVLSALSIHYTFTPIVDPEHTGARQRWSEREVVSALYEGHQKVVADEQREVVGDFAV